ncbi:ATP-dependent RNA helicase, partial [Coemansia erecta]
MNPPPMPKSKGLAAQNKKRTVNPNKTKITHRKGLAKTYDDGKLDSGEESNPEMTWKPVPIPAYITGPDEEIGGMIGLEELEDVDCVWEEDKETGGRFMTLCKAKKRNASKGKNRSADNDSNKAENNNDDDDDFHDSVDWDEFVHVDDYSEEKAESGELISIGTLIREKQRMDSEEEESDLDDAKHMDVDDEDRSAPAPAPAPQPEFQDDDDIQDPDVDVARWEKLGLHMALLRALKHLGFPQPTDIQSKCLPHALEGRDIIGAAETGSGKTLAFGVPMLQYVVQHKGEEWIGPTGLVLAPTRELALQVRNHLTAMARFTRARIVAIVGGMSQAKQERLLGHQPDIIIATPGRFWELVSTNSTYQSQIMAIKFLAIDEADRMLEPGHFRELRFLFKLLNKTELVQKEQHKRQTFVFSATLLKDLHLVARHKPLKKKSKKGPQPPEPGSMEDLIERVNFQDKQPVFVDVTQADATARTLVEARIDCLASEKDYYL